MIFFEKGQCRGGYGGRRKGLLGHSAKKSG